MIKRNQNLLQQLNVPVPKGDTAYDEEDLERIIKRIGYPIVIKPLNGNHGRGSTMHIMTWDDAAAALKGGKFPDGSL